MKKSEIYGIEDEEGTIDPNMLGAPYHTKDLSPTQADAYKCLVHLKAAQLHLEQFIRLLRANNKMPRVRPSTAGASGKLATTAQAAMRDVIEAVQWAMEDCCLKGLDHQAIVSWTEKIVLEQRIEEERRWNEL